MQNIAKDELMKAWEENRVIVLPVPIGAPVYAPYQCEFEDGYMESGVDTLYLSGYSLENGCELLLTYDEKCGGEVFERKDIYLSYKKALASINKERKNE